MAVVLSVKKKNYIYIYFFMNTAARCIRLPPLRVLERVVCLIVRAIRKVLSVVKQKLRAIRFLCSHLGDDTINDKMGKSLWLP